MSDFLVIIPARLNSTRLPGKALADIGGKPMVVRVLEQARLSRATRVLVATDHDEIRRAVELAGGEVLMTRADHPSGTDRLAECVNLLGLDDDEIVVNVQGDEPLIPPAIINQVARNLATRPQAGLATLCEPIQCLETFLNPNVVKVVRSESGMALYFSRAPIPWNRDRFLGNSLSAQLASSPVAGQTRDSDVPVSGDSPVLGYRHIGLYAYRAGLLRDFTTWHACALEQTEALEQLRAQWNDVKIHVDVAEVSPEGGVDTPQDLDRVRQKWSTVTPVAS